MIKMPQGEAGRHQVSLLTMNVNVDRNIKTLVLGSSLDRKASTSAYYVGGRANALPQKPVTETRKHLCARGLLSQAIP